jgi:hypothetical protein
MTAGGWVIMLFSVGVVTIAFAWCVVRVLRTPEPEERLHAPLGIEHDEPE